ncbi:MAG: 50S ribosomal protein L17 [Saprospiraceae bacterium]
MRHGDKVNNLGRTASHRRAMLANMAISLIEHKRITTTLAKAKALRRYVEPLLTKAKDDTTHSRRVVFSYLQNKEAIKELFSTISEKIAHRPGGYVRVIKLGFRRGDGAETALIELVDFNESYNPNAGKVKKAKKTRRGSGGSVKKAVEPVAIAAAEPAAAEVMAAEETTSEVAAEMEEVVADVSVVEEETTPDAPAAEEGEEKKEDA